MPRWTQEEYAAWQKRRQAAEKVAATRRPWTDQEIELLRVACSDPSKPVDLECLAKAWNRSYFSVAIKASRMGFGNLKRPKRPESTAARVESFKCTYQALPTDEKQKRREKLSEISKSNNPFKGKKHSPESRAKMSESVKRAIAENGHPRGMLGKHHSEDTKNRLSEIGVGRVIPRERVERMLRTKVSRYGCLANPTREGASWKAQWADVGGQRFYARSLWEVNYARYLEFLKSTGEVISWQHEPETFWFTGIKRGCVSYLPDFKVTFFTGAVEYHEVKGWMDARSKTKIQRMAKYFPGITLIVIDKERYTALSRMARRIVPGWQVSRKVTEGPNAGKPKYTEMEPA